MSVIAGLEDFRKHGPPADIGTFQFATTAMIFQFTFSGVIYTVAIASGIDAWNLIAQSAAGADDVEIQAAIDYIETQGGGSLFFDEGSYFVSVTVNWPTDASDYTTPISIRGTGWASIISRSAAVPLFTFAGGANRCRNIIMRDLCLRSESYTGELLRFIKADRIRIEDVLFRGTVAASYAIYAEHSWDAILYGCLFHGGGDATTPIVHLFNGGTNNCNNWTFIVCRWERGTTFNSLALHSDGTGAGTLNHNIRFFLCKIHGASDASFTNGAILFESTERSSVKNCWIAHHLGNVVDVDQNCELVDVSGNNFLTSPAQGNPTSFIHLDGNDCKAKDNFTEGTPTQLVLVGTNANDCVVNNIISATVAVNYLTDNGTDTILPSIRGTFTKELGTAVWSLTKFNPMGIVIDEDLEGALCKKTLPRGLNQVIRITVAAISNIVEADAMRLEVNAFAGGDNQPWNREAMIIANKASDTTNFAADDVIKWVFTVSDDVDIGDLTSGDLLQWAVYHEVAGDGDAATDILLAGDCLEIEYI